MFTSFGPFFIMPVCYHPTTILMVDDDEPFCKSLSLQLSNELSLKYFDKAKETYQFLQTQQQYFLFSDCCFEKQKNKTQFSLKKLKDEIYNNNRFKEIIITIVDYDMPGLNGFELMKLLKFPSEIQFYAYIMLTGKMRLELEDKIISSNLQESFIEKSDRNYLEKLLATIKNKTQSLFQWYSYPIAQEIARDSNENTSVLFDANFVGIFNQIIEEHQICEFYLYDKQGSYLFLDKLGTPSWLFIRNEQGIENSIKMAKHYNAPESVICSLQSKEVILSLYEQEDFENKSTINWSDYLLPVQTLKTNKEYTQFLKLADQSKIYYAYTSEFPGNSLKRQDILSYDTFLQNNQ